MEAVLEITDHNYLLDWNGNDLCGNPPLVINSLLNRQWLLIDILLSIFRCLPQKPSAIFIPPSSNAKEKVLTMFRSWGAETPSFEGHSLVYLDGHLLKLDTHNISDLKMGTCRVININYES